MTPDPEYLGKILRAFQESEGPTTDIEELEAKGLSYETDEFYFHLRLMNDQGFVERDDQEPGLGVESLLSEGYSWIAVPLRLTASGHEFAEAMGHSKAFEAVRKSLITSSIGLMRDVAVDAFKMEVKKHGVDLG